MLCVIVDTLFYPFNACVVIGVLPYFVCLFVNCASARASNLLASGKALELLPSVVVVTASGKGSDSDIAVDGGVGIYVQIVIVLVNAIAALQNFVFIRPVETVGEVRSALLGDEYTLVVLRNIYVEVAAN